MIKIIFMISIMFGILLHSHTMWKFTVSGIFIFTSVTINYDSLQLSPCIIIHCEQTRNDRTQSNQVYVS